MLCLALLLLCSPLDEGTSKTGESGESVSWLTLFLTLQERMHP